MPQLVRTPEQIFRDEQKDLYILRSNQGWGRDAPGLVMIRRWITDNLPGTHMEVIGPSERSGYILGGIGHQWWVDFDEEGLRRFCEQWEDENGKSLDGRFQCLVWSFDQWRSDQALRNDAACAGEGGETEEDDE